MKKTISLVSLVPLVAIAQPQPPMHFFPQVQSNYEAAMARVTVPTQPPLVSVPGSPFYATNVILDLPPYLAAYVQSNLSAYITAATNRVSTLSHLEFSVTITNITPTNVTIHPRSLKNGLGTVQIFDARGALLVNTPDPPFMTMPVTRAEFAAEPPRDLILKPGESYTFKNKLAEHFSLPTPPGTYRAREGFIPSNVVEITIE